MPNTMAMFTRTLGTVGISTTTAVGTRLTSPSRTGKAQRIISSGREANPISNEHHLKAVPPIDPVQAAVTIDPVKPVLSVPVAVSTDLAVEVGRAIWIAKLRTDHVAIFRASGSKAFRAAASIAPAVAADLADSVVIASAAVVDLEVIALVVAASAAVVALAASAAAEGADGKN